MSYEITFSITALCSSCGKELPTGSYLTESKPTGHPLDRDNPYERKDRRVFIRPCEDCYEWKPKPQGVIAAMGTEAGEAVSKFVNAVKEASNG